MQITVSKIEQVEITDVTVKRVVHDYLERFVQGRWVRDGKLWEETYTSHRFDVELGGPEHPDYKLVEAVQTARGLIMEREEALDARVAGRTMAPGAKRAK